ncbi:pectinesterase/pectinesterase inhibitor PPE8B-like [Aristolochia californica]|uniref:pectinesterase/pectinesterase inhibitor PPE8B-like n=1 Tax=Aristolochia californica TaxID=171875 RepID=UPI0035D6CFBA
MGFVVVLSVFLLLSVPVISSSIPEVQSEYLSVPSPIFSSNVKLIISEIQRVLSLISKFTGPFGGRRLSNAVNDCAELLDFSADELTWSLAATQNPDKKVNGTGTGKERSDLKAWLSAALGNQETCLDGFDGTDGIVKQLVAGSLTAVTSSVAQVLKMVRDIPGANVFPGGGRKLLQKDGFPDWMSTGERKLLQAPIGGVKANVTVAQDGTGNFTTVMEAVNAAPDNSSRRFVIYIKKGVYKENVEIKKKKWNLMMIGEGMGVTVITGNKSFIDGWTTFRSATFAVSGRGFIARDMTFENTAGPEKHQAVALRSDSDLSVIYRCGIHGYQDTLYAHSLRQFYRECRISGTVDFIFGNGAVVFQNCQILARKPLPNQKNSITAQGRKDPEQNTGFTIQFCNISADSDLLMSQNATSTYLGRPWKLYSRTIFMQSYMSSVIRAEGWLEWQGGFALDSLYYAEFMNYGPGAGLGGRVKWPGYHVLNDTAQARNFTVEMFIDGNLWLPATGVKYTAGLAI